MSNHVTFDTAKRLAAAGFPQPEFTDNANQHWYDKIGRLKVFLSKDKKESIRPFKFFNFATAGLDFWASVESHVFAPTATDILEQLNTGPQEYDGWFLGSGGFVCEYKQGEGFVRSETSHSLAESSATAWLNLRKPAPIVNPDFLPW